MGRQAPLTTAKPQSEINLTPLMDLTFILLITFIITFPLVEQGIPVNLPEGQRNQASTADATRTVTIDASGMVYLDEAPVSNAALSEALARLAQEEPNVTVYVRADKSVDYGEVVKVLQVLHEVKLTRIALVTQAES